MRILNRYILREIAWPAALALTVVGFVGVLNEIRERPEIPFAFATVTDLVQLIVYFLPSLLSYIIPVAYMMGILLAFGGFAQSNEITAMKAAGIPLKRALLPVILGGVALTGVVFVLQDRVQPAAFKRANELIYVNMAVRATLDVLPAGVMHKFGDWRVFIGSKDAETKTLRDIDILVPTQVEPIVYTAKSARLVENDGRKKIILQEGYLTQPQESGDLLIVTFPTRELDLPKIALKQAQGRLQQLSLARLLAFQRGKGTAADYDGVSPQDRTQIRDSRVEIGNRLAFPLACLAVSIVAAPLAVRAQRGGRSYSFAVGFGIVLVFYLLHFALEPQSLKPLAEVVARSVAPDLVLGLAGAWFLWRVDRV